jgi:diaminohydroxyphosphoribosylaminopyrimidine deaminase/5-amino-6-(5-phosphoribosylamino)uracil reductase
LAVGEGVEEARLASLSAQAGVSAIRCPVVSEGLDLGVLLDRLGERGILSVLVEGGAGIMGSMIRSRLIDKAYVFKAPKLLGGDDGVPVASGPGAGRMEDCLVLGRIRVRRFGDDVLIRGYPRQG